MGWGGGVGGRGWREQVRRCRIVCAPLARPGTERRQRTRGAERDQRAGEEWGGEGGRLRHRNVCSASANTDDFCCQRIPPEARLASETPVSHTHQKSSQSLQQKHDSYIRQDITSDMQCALQSKTIHVAVVPPI